MKRIVSGIMLILLASMLMSAFSIQSIQKSGIISNVVDGLADFGGESGGFEAQSGSVDWWPMFHHDLTRTGYSTSKAPSNNKTLWSYTTGGSIWSSPAVADGKLYIGSWDDRKVYALNASTGAFIWSYTTSNAIGSSPAVVNDRLYICLFDNFGTIYALNASTGAPLWSYQLAPTGIPTSNIRSSPAVVGGIVYVGSWNGKVYALNASTGALKWSYATSDRIESSPAVADGKLYIGSIDKKVYALNASTGALKWNYTTGNAVSSSPTVANGKLYIGSCDTNVYALNASSGAFIWSYATGSTIDFSSPAVADGKLYVGTNNGKVYALNASTGALKWSYTTGGAVYSSPAVADGKLYVGSYDHKVYAFGSHDVAITSVTPSTAQAYSGQIVNINVVARNKGTPFNETFDVSAYYDSVLISTLAVTDLPEGAEKILTFNWNTTNVPGGYYIISANATVVPGENHTADNNFIDGTIKITSPVRIAEVIPCNQTGYAKNTFKQGAMAYFKVTMNSTALVPQNTLITINLYDNASNAIGIASFQGPILPGISTIIFGLPIPTTATIGTATIYANCYTDWPSQGGFPHCPEMSATLEITGP